MDYPVQAPELTGHSVLVRVKGMFADPQVLSDGTKINPIDGEYRVPAAGPDGKDVTIRLKAPLLDFVPIVFVADRRVEIAPALQWWQYLWALVPTILLLVIFRGVVPALLGLAISYFSVFLIRDQPARRSVWPSVINVVVVLGICAFLAVKVAARHAGGR